MFLKIIFPFFVLIAGVASSQIAIGQWRDHLPYNKAVSVTEVGNKIYCATDNALFFYNKSDYSLGKMSKVDGLSDIGITTMKYDEFSKTIFVGYSNGNIDLIQANTVFNISDIKRKSISGLKSINNVCFIQGHAYVSTAFGIVVIDMMAEEIKETYYIGFNGANLFVYDIAYDSQNLYAATETGIYFVSRTSPNPSDYNYWSQIVHIPNYYKRFNAITSFENKIVASYKSDETNQDSIYVFSLLSWDLLDSLKHNIKSLTVQNNMLIVANTDKIQIFDTDFTEILTITSFGLSPLQVRSAIFDTNEKLWIADNLNGLVCRNDDGTYSNYIPNGPYDNRVVSIAIKGNKLWAAAGGKNGSWNNVWYEAELHNFENESWTSYRSSNVSQFYGMYDINKVMIDPENDNHLYAASWNYGLIEINNKEVTAVYKADNSSLQSIFPGQNYYRIYGLAFDNSNNLWITNTQVSSPISVKTNDNKWYSFEYANLINASIIGDIIVTQSNVKWVVLPKGMGVFAFDEKGTYENLSDDDYLKFGVLDANGQVISNDIYSIAEDHDGQIYLGTNKGIVVYYNPDNVFAESNFYGQRIIIPSDIPGQASYLFENEIITSIVVDGANRKWIGTESSGVFLMSEDLSEQIYHFNTSNSPLLSDNIICIAVDGNNGEVFFGTEKGMISYKGTATEGGDTFSEVYAFPNPVRESYNGPITIRGLVTNSNVKIADIAGNIVYETTAEGGQAIWFGKDFSGRRVSTGIYLVFSSNEDGSETNVSKILFIN
jgi:ligand-binding sensor domain-containing protein